MTKCDLKPAYRSEKLFGAGKIFRTYLGLAPDEPLPLTIPHGVDIYVSRVPLDLHSTEPLYLATREDIAARVARYKAPLLFPHPWFMMEPLDAQATPSGTLFLAPPPLQSTFDQLHEAALRSAYPKPWGVLLKDRALTDEQLDWWKRRGYETHTAGPIVAEDFYYRLRSTLARYETIASPLMSSALVFAAEMGRRLVAMPDIDVAYIDVPNLTSLIDFDDEEGLVHRVWSNLLSADPAVSTAQARDILGHQFMDTPARLRSAYRDAVARLHKPIHLHPVRSPLVTNWLAAPIRLGVSVDRLFPRPLRKVGTRMLSAVGQDEVLLVRGSDFAHYGLAGSSGPLRIRKMKRNDVAVELGASFVAAHGRPARAPPSARQPQ